MDTITIGMNCAIVKCGQVKMTGLHVTAILEGTVYLTKKRTHKNFKFEPKSGNFIDSNNNVLATNCAIEEEFYCD